MTNRISTNSIAFSCVSDHINGESPRKSRSKFLGRTKTSVFPSRAYQASLSTIASQDSREYSGQKCESGAYAQSSLPDLERGVDQPESYSLQYSSFGSEHGEEVAISDCLSDLLIQGQVMLMNAVEGSVCRIREVSSGRIVQLHRKVSV